MKMIAVFLLGLVCLNAEIIQIEKLADFPISLEEINEDVLIVFDIDDVIFSTEDHFAHPYGYLKFVELTNLALAKCSSDEEKEALMHKVSLSQVLSKRNLVEEEMPQFIQHLQKTGAKVIALTNFPRGKYGSIPKTEAWRRESLLKFGVDFHTDFFGSEYELDEIAKEGSVAPAFAKGIIFSYGYSKGETLAAFLKKNQFTPSRVILIEDMLYHHHSVNSSLTELGIPFMGIHYTAGHKNFGVCNEKLLTHQFNHLVSTSEWLKDQEILEMWNQCSK